MSMKTSIFVPASSQSASTSKPRARNEFTTPRAHAPDTRMPLLMLAFPDESPTGRDRSHMGERITSPEGELSQFVARSVSPFVVGGARGGCRFAIVHSVRGGHQRHGTRQRMSPPSHPESGETAFPADGARLGLPQSAPMMRSRSTFYVDRFRLSVGSI